MTCDLFSAIDVQADESMNSQNGKCSERGRPLSQRSSIAFLVAVAVAVAGCTSEKDRLDAEAKSLCAIDGGIKVFETVTLAPEKVNQYGQPLIPTGRDDKGFGYYLRGDQQHIAGQMSQLAGDGAGLKKHTSQIIRTADGKLMGESIVYRRHGGSWWDGIMEGDGFTCPEDKINTTFMEKVIFKGKSQ